MKPYRLKIFCDFDGTIALNDVWINSLGKFINNNPEFNRIIEEYHSGKINTRVVNLKLLSLVENFSYSKFNSLLDEEQIDEHFPDFLNFCKENDHEISIVSGGLDYYINYILKRERIDVKFYSSRMIFDERSGKLTCDFEFGDEYCRDCETCKRNILISGTNDYENEISVFIGDGVSDFCVSGYADVVFAKGKLASYCWKNNITYFEYKNFADIKNKIIKLNDKRKVRQRQEAKLRRRDVIMGG